ncbi:CvpA family protein [Haoranjiania flava]|uniref:CvpA family protein n=1 Tax=Haoranjiania flava TaxID=1856322 RepID=A0AAE3IQK8_9BACT|nr:CvpA family protein [Haoranjiania flava]MCU7693992.1 CvpA family protein [Haoranjiania flava]
MIDIIVAITIAFAVFKGYTKGLIVALFSFVGIIIGLAAAMKLSVVLAGYFASHGMEGRWVTLLSFIIVMFSVALLVRWVARLIQRSVEFVMLGWINRLGGIAFYALLYLTLLSVLLFYLTRIGIVSDGSVAGSVTYPYIQPLGPYVIENIGKIVPVFKGMFNDLANFFDGLAPKSAM